MFPAKVLLSCLLLALSVADASPLVRNAASGKATLKFATSIKASGFSNLAEHDRARAQAMKEGAHLGKRSGYPVGATNTKVSYTVEVGIGSPPTDYTLLIDTGSSNTWIGANKAYVQTGSGQDTGHTVSVSYGSGSFSGEEWVDDVTLSPDLVVSQQSIGVASSATGLSPDVDGILGVGPVVLTKGTVDGVDTVPTVLDNLLSQGTISEEVLGVLFVPASEATSTGELTFGGYDESQTTTPVVSVPLTTTSPASDYWGIDQSISYGGQTILSATAGIVDTGSTLILIATDAFKTYQSLTGGTPDSATGLLSITPDQFYALQPLEFNIGGVPFVLTPNAQIWPRALNSAIGGSSDAIYLVVSDIGTSSGSGLDFINGYTFLERFYSVYDATNQQVGFALTRYTLSESN